jgi:hypothetical protein
VLIKQIKSNIKQMVSKNSGSRNTKLRREKMTQNKRTGIISYRKTSLFQSIGQRVRVGKFIGSFTVVGARYPDGAHAHLVERGHRIVTRDGRDTGKRTRPIPFQRKAEHSVAKLVLQVQRDRFRQEVRKLRMEQASLRVSELLAGDE